MRGHAGLAVVSTLVLLCIPGFAPAGCPLMAGVNITCDSKFSSIETCVNAIWSDLAETSALVRSLKNMPDNPADRMARLREAKAAVHPAIRLLGAASDYPNRNRGASCDAAWEIESCEGALRSARHGIELLTKPELVAALSPDTREKLRRFLRQREARYTAGLDLLAASGQGDPSQLCNTTYASVASCERAVAADSTALREQVFPVFMCGQVIPGKFVTAKDAAAEAQRDADRSNLKIVPSNEFTFDVASRFYQNRLQQETELLEKAKQAR